MNEGFDYQVTSFPKLPGSMEKVCEMSGLDKYELHRTFNMGVGMVIATDSPLVIIDELEKLGENGFVIGNIKKGNGKIFLDGIEL